MTDLYSFIMKELKESPQKAVQKSTIDIGAKSYVFSHPALRL